MYWAEKIAEFKKKVEELEFRNNRLDFDSLSGLNSDLRKHLQPIDHLWTASVRLKGINQKQSIYKDASPEYKKQRFLIAKQETLELIGNIELILHKLTEGQYDPDACDTKIG
jgi:hypothetical protein